LQNPGSSQAPLGSGSASQNPGVSVQAPTSNEIVDKTPLNQLSLLSLLRRFQGETTPVPSYYPSEWDSSNKSITFSASGQMDQSGYNLEISTRTIMDAEEQFKRFLAFSQEEINKEKKALEGIIFTYHYLI
jgi:hypothetical protein